MEPLTKWYFCFIPCLLSIERRRILQKCSVYKLFEFQTLEFEKTDLLLLQPRNFDWLTFWIRNMSHLLLYRISCFYIKQQRTLNPNIFFSPTCFKTDTFTVFIFPCQSWGMNDLCCLNSLKVTLSTHSCVQNTFV